MRKTEYSFGAPGFYCSVLYKILTRCGGQVVFTIHTVRFWSDTPHFPESNYAPFAMKPGAGQCSSQTDDIYNRLRKAYCDLTDCNIASSKPPECCHSVHRAEWLSNSSEYCCGQFWLGVLTTCVQLNTGYEVEYTSDAECQRLGILSFRLTLGKGILRGNMCHVLQDINDSEADP